MTVAEVAGVGPSVVATSTDRAAIAWVALGALLFSTGPMMVRASTISGPAFSFWRLWAGTAIFGVAAGIQAVLRRRPLSREALRLTALAGVVFGVHQLFFMSAVKATSVTDVLLVQSLTPLVVAVFAVPMFGERVGRRFRVWSLVAMLGSGAVALGASAGPEGDPVGITYAFVNVVLFAFFFLLTKRSRGTVDMVPFLAGVLLVAGITVTAFVHVTEGGVHGATRADILYAVALAAVPGGLGHLAMTWPLKRVPANLPPVIKLPTPFVAGLMTWALLGEAMTWMHVFGGVVTLGGALGAIRSIDMTSGRTLVPPDGAATLV